MFRNKSLGALFADMGIGGFGNKLKFGDKDLTGGLLDGLSEFTGKIPQFTCPCYV